MSNQDFEFKDLTQCVESDVVLAAKLLALAWQEYYDALSDSADRRVKFVAEQLCVPNTELVNSRALFRNNVLVAAHACYPGEQIAGLFQGSNLHFMRLQKPSERTEFQKFLKQSGANRPTIQDNAYYISRFSVSSTHRASGTADELLRDVFTAALTSGHNLLSLHVATDNDRAIRFYKRRGFTIAGERGGFFSMELTLNDNA